MVYAGPLRDEPLAVELHNTLYADAGARHDALSSRACAYAWLEALGERVPTGGSGPWPTLAELVALRTAVRTALQSAVADAPQAAPVIDAINRASAGAARSPRATWRADSAPVAGVDYHGASRAQIVIAAFAWDTIDLLTGPRGGDLRTCGAPGCVLLFLKDHPRREWCSNGCGNRARQARHYERSRRRTEANTGSITRCE